MAEAKLAGRDVSRETWEQLRAFEAMVRRWNATINLVSRGSLDDLWRRHIEDSAQIFDYCPASARTWVDLGAGAGFPGIVISILARERMPDLTLTLVESDLRKATFLRLAIRELALRADVLSERIESLPGRQADVLSARALAPLRDLLGMAETHLKPEGAGIFPKGGRYLEEIAEARKLWTFDVEAQPSKLQPSAAILIVRKIKRAQHP